MQSVMPLFGFEGNNIQSYSFGDSGIFIRPFEGTACDFSELEGLSEKDICQIKRASWALVYEGDDDRYKSLVNLLLMSFRVFSDHPPPVIKYRLSKNSGQSFRINQPMTRNLSANKGRASYGSTDIEQIDAGFQHLRKMDAISPRTHNAIYFLYRAFHADKWIDSFVLMMCSLESLFSKDQPGGATDAITTRVSSLLGSRDRCTKADLENLYKLRSDMTHGRIEVGDDARKNLESLEHLEFVAVHCFRELVKKKAYVRYATPSERNKFMGTLNGTKGMVGAAHHAA